jgi:Core-2/I-Branching enzyme
MKICYLIQTHKNIEQIYRLVKVIKTSSPQSYIYIIHDSKKNELNKELFQEFSDIKITNRKAQLGDFSLIQGYFDCIEFLIKNNIDFDWLINLSGQDYPTQPLPKIEKFLQNTNYDAFAQYFDVLSPQNPWEAKLGHQRYFYHYWRSSQNLTNWQRILIKPIKDIVNASQLKVKIETSYALAIGWERKHTPFHQKFICYGGSFFTTLSKKCVIHLYQVFNNNKYLVQHYQKTSQAEESLIQSILVNSGLFNISNHHHRYIDYNLSKYGHPRILTHQDYHLLLSEKIQFARKFDIYQDVQILDLLDKRIFA